MNKRKRIVAGNWKMNKSVDEGKDLSKEILESMNNIPSDVELILCPPYTHLDSVSKITEDCKNINIGAQNCASETQGAYTGEISAADIIEKLMKEIE